MIDRPGRRNYRLQRAGGPPATESLRRRNVTNAVGLTPADDQPPHGRHAEFRVSATLYAETALNGGVIGFHLLRRNQSCSAFEFLRNSVLDARNFFATQKPPLRLNQYGGSFGGPIRKDKTHFFATWEETRQLSSTITLQTVPTAAQRLGDFSSLPAQLYDPATTVGRDRQPFAGNIIPTSRFDPVAANVLAYWPQPNRAGAANFSANNNATLRRDIGVVKVDHRLTQNDQLTLRYYINDSFIENLGSFGLPVSDANANTNDARIQSILGSHTHTFSPNLVNDFKVSFLQRKFIDMRYGAGETRRLLDHCAARRLLPSPCPATPPSATRHPASNVHPTSVLESISFRGRPP
jgi:hypothetical protein